MSRAFVREDDADKAAAGLPERPQSPHTNYVTPRGLAMLERKIQTLESEARRLRGSEELVDRQRVAYAERDLRYYRERLKRAVPVDPAKQPEDRVHFGATVVVLDEDDRELSFTIVGEDEADAAAGKISWVSPLARALLNMQVGDEVVWDRPAGAMYLEVLEIRKTAPE